MSYRVYATDDLHLEIEQKLNHIFRILVAKDMYYEAMYLAFLRDTGYRQQEIQNIRWRNIDQEGVLSNVPSSKPGESICNSRQLNTDTIIALRQWDFADPDALLFPKTTSLLRRICTVTSEKLTYTELKRYAQQRLCERYITTPKNWPN